MRYLQVSRQTLLMAQCSVPAQANSFFPVGNQRDHIHLGTPTSYLRDGGSLVAEEGNVFVTYVSFKRNNAFWFRLVHNENDGYFSFPGGRSAADLPDNWQAALRALRIVRSLGA